MEIKKIAIAIIVALNLAGCQDDVVFNSPAFQGDKEQELWRANTFNASIDINGFLTISGSTGIETVDLVIPSVSEGTYTVGDVDSIEGRFTDAFGTVFSTNNRPDPSVSIYSEYGEIILEEIDFVNATFSGRFTFLAFDDSGLNSVAFSFSRANGGTNQNLGGVFYKIPLTSGSIPTVVFTCVDAREEAQTALTNYETTFTGVDIINSDDYEATCLAYIVALETQKTYCGDVSGDIQTIIDDLADCQLTCDQATSNRNFGQLAFSTTTLGNYIQSCNDYTLYLTEQIEFCGDDTGDIQSAIDDLNCNDADGDGVADVLEDSNGDGNFDNDDFDSDSIPNYLDDDDDGDGVLTADELMLDADGNAANTDGSGGSDYLDNDDDGDGILTINESADVAQDTDADSIPDYLDNDDDGDGVFTIYETGDTDTDGNLDYLDNDDDGDGTLTIDENADPNGDGNPDDAQDTDSDGIPDYLDNI